MDVRKILTIIIGIVIALGGLALTVSFLSSKAPERSPTETTFVSSPSNETATVKAGSAVAEKGSLQLGRFGLFQLTNEETALEFISAEYDPKTESIASARGRVNAGSVLAVDLLFGTELTLLDDRMAATSHGGSFVFEKTSGEEGVESTRVRVLSGYAEVSFTNSDNSETFAAVLLAGEEISLDDTAIEEIFAAGDEIAQITEWRSKIGRFSSKFEGESRLIGKFLDELPKSSTNAVVDFIKENLIFNAEKKEKFYAVQLAGTLATAASGDASSVDELLATSNAKKRALLKTVVARALPFTRLFVSDALAPNLKDKIGRLAELSMPLADFAGIATLSPRETLNRELIFIYDDPDNTNYTQKFLTSAKNGIEEADEASAKLLLAIMKLDPKELNSDWLEAWSAVNRTRIVDNSDLANAIIEQLELADVFVRAGRETLAGSTLKELAGLLSRGSTEFDEVSLESIAATGNEFRNRVLFLASLRGESEFEETAYQIWLDEQERLATEAESPPEEEPEEEISAPADDPNRVARPESELIKFLDIDFPESDTQTAEEEMLEEEETTTPDSETMEEGGPTEEESAETEGSEPVPEESVETTPAS
ncbi:MAG: hypothetical protein K9L85_04010 [Candidatus Peribacteraceae bacterium]|nr:hypothetical protein [Candidatus Peribacteraceae bacterium]